MNNYRENIDAIKTIAIVLEEINNDVMYVGGAVVSFYIQDSFKDEIRPTEDIDIVLEITSLTELEKLRKDLIQKGFKQSHEDDVICRFNYKSIKIDVMATKEIAWAPANKWFKEGFENCKIIKLDNIEIKILPLPYFLASKFEAFYNRGYTDARTSKDFEDIVYLINNAKNLENEILNTRKNVQLFIKKSFQNILASSLLQEAVRAHLSFENDDERFDFIMSFLKKMI